MKQKYNRNGTKRDTIRTIRLVSGIFVFAMIGALLLALIAPAAYATIEEIENQIKLREHELEEAQKTIEEINANISGVSEILNEVNVKIYATTQKINEIEAEIRDLSSDIEATEAEIAIKEIELKRAEDETRKIQDLLYKRLRVMYKAGTVGYLEVLFGSDSMQELLSRADILQRLVAYDQGLIDELEIHKAGLENKKKDLGYKKEHLEELLAQRVEKKTAQQNLLNDLHAYSLEVQQNIAALEEQAAIKMRESEEIRNAIEQLELSKQAYIGGDMVWPVPSSYEISSPFGPRPEMVAFGAPYFHTGTDIAAPTGDPIVAAQSGTVIVSTFLSGYGYTVMIDHGGGIVTVYAHMNAIYVNVGQEVALNEVIGEIGSTGLSSGPHLHFEVRVDGTPTEPMEYIGQYVGW